MPTPAAKYFLEKLGRARRDQMLLGKIRRGIHQTKHLDDALHLFQILQFICEELPADQSLRCELPVFLLR